MIGADVHKPVTFGQVIEPAGSLDSINAFVLDIRLIGGLANGLAVIDVVTRQEVACRGGPLQHGADRSEFAYRGDGGRGGRHYSGEVDAGPLAVVALAAVAAHVHIIMCVGGKGLVEGVGGFTHVVNHSDGGQVKLGGVRVERGGAVGNLPGVLSLAAGGPAEGG